MSFIRWLSSSLGRSPRPASGRNTPFGSLRFRPVIEALEDRRLLSGGVLDPTFGTGGIVNSTLNGNTVPEGMAISPSDGKIVVTGWDDQGHTAHLAVIRYNPDGSLDKSFGRGGEVIGSAGTFAQAVVVQPDGKILAAAYSANFSLARFNTDGSMDNTFGSRGCVTTDIASNSTDMLQNMSLQADGKIVVAGTSRPANSTNYYLALARYNRDGSLDSTFGNGGKLLSQIVTTYTQGMGLAVDSGAGQIVVEAANTTGDTATIVR